MHRKLGTIVTTLALTLGVVFAAAPAQADFVPLPPYGAPETCWVDVTWFPNPDGLPACSADAQPTLYLFARAILGWEGVRDTLSENVQQLQRANYRKYLKIKQLRREVRHLRAQH